MTTTNLRLQSPAWFCVACAMLSVAAGCGSSSSDASYSNANAVQGAADMHCTMGGMEIKTAIGMCVTDTAADSGASDDGGASDDASAGADGGGGATKDFGETLYNAEGDDDDCKYHVKWKATDVKEGTGVTFEVTVTRRADGKPATAADVQIEAFLSDTHPTPSVEIKNKETSAGVYRVGPVIFDMPGKWTVRFHFYEMCSDAPKDSPHGHAAFYLNVP